MKRTWRLETWWLGDALALALPNAALHVWWGEWDGWRSRWLLELLDSPAWWLGASIVTWFAVAPAVALLASGFAGRDLAQGRQRPQALLALCLALLVIRPGAASLG